MCTTKKYETLYNYNKVLKPLNYAKYRLLWFFAATCFKPGGQTDSPKKNLSGGDIWDRGI